MKRFKINLQLFAGESDPIPPVEPPVDPTPAAEPKTYTEEELIKIREDLEKDYNDKIEKAKKDGMTEAERLAALTESERNAEKLKNLEVERDKYKNDLESRTLREEAIKLLGEKKLDASFVDIVIAKDAETIKANVTKVEEMFNVQVQKAVEEKLKGDTPKTGTGSSGTDVSSLKGALTDKYNK